MTLIEHYAVVEEGRSDVNIKHDLIHIFLVIGAISAGAEDWYIFGFMVMLKTG